MPLAVAEQSLNHWTTGEVPQISGFWAKQTDLYNMDGPLKSAEALTFPKQGILQQTWSGILSSSWGSSLLTSSADFGFASQVIPWAIL